MPNYPPSSAAHIPGWSSHRRAGRKRRKRLLLLWLCPSPAGTVRPSVHCGAPTSAQNLITAISLSPKQGSDVHSMQLVCKWAATLGGAMPTHQRQRKPRVDQCCAKRAPSELHVGSCSRAGPEGHMGTWPQGSHPHTLSHPHGALGATPNLVSQT